MLFLKDTFFIMYLDVFATVPWMRVCSLIGLFLNTSVYFSFSVVIFYFETPGPGHTWLDMATGNNITTMLSLIVPMAVFGLVTDLCILALPLIAVSGMQMDKGKKTEVILLFSTGSL